MPSIAARSPNNTSAPFCGAFLIFTISSSNFLAFLAKFPVYHSPITTKMEELVDLLPMGEALAKIEAEPIYREAKQQFEALQRCIRNAHRADSVTAPDFVLTLTVRLSDLAVKSPATEMPFISPKGSHIAASYKQINLSQYYRDLFDNATKALDPWQKLQLLTICFAYKTKERILYFLDLLESKAFRWITTFKHIIHDRAKDTAFESSRPKQHDINTLPDVNPNSPYSLRSKNLAVKATPAKQPTSYFILPTLPLAFPTHFFTAFVSHAPLSALTLPSILSCPAATQLALSDPLRELLQSFQPNFWKPATQVQKKSWAAFFVHLQHSRKETLCLSNGGDFQVDNGEVGYSKIDLEMWLAGWKAERQTSFGGGDDVLVEKRAPVKQAAVVKNAAGSKRKVEWKEFNNGDGGQAAESEKIVALNTLELEKVGELPIRMKKRKKRKN
ncbi:uncharacterized protein BDR25DRAFT_348221 [Lindgomyces ingoldianus]|uniref:Uncharacterized protein n=1 Tax=Lindgomyces ingoldianus TaxID=673940 RepID=A0ACB6RFM9_9PLEO|nr:uncharacterized protein BDR25DRAFT_348221 [Lindgomyces ingoldianus]KAF2477917.1 hypothetical protein BDR25DRAFT_348221 [Lindgomyces ingoldianus]